MADLIFQGLTFVHFNLESTGVSQYINLTLYTNIVRIWCFS